VKNASRRGFALVRLRRCRDHAAVKLGITLKLFLAILAASAAAAAAMAIATRLSFQSGFLGYLEQRDLQRVDTLTAKLAGEYRRTGSWDFIRGDYARLIALAIADQPAPRLSVLDHSGGLVVGNPEPSGDAAVRAVVVDGDTVGWLARSPFRRLTSAADLNFQQEQLRSGWIIAALALALAALVALLLARLFLQPIKRLAEATHKLSAGAYDTRVSVRSGDEFGRLAADFNRLAHVLERNEQSRRRFMADVSHELRTPLAILKGEVEALEDGVRPLSRESLASLNHEVAALGKLVDDLYQLALADVGAAAYRKERIDAAHVLLEAVNAFAERLGERGIRVQTQLAPAMVLADGDRLGQAFRNLLENSLRYTDPGGCVRVVARREGARIVISFEDSEPGIAAEAMPRLFERFYRVEASRNRARGGAGLGLAICRSIVEAHDGEIAAAASPLGGLAVTMVLPAAS
jgi:two-component system, OmpR family, sensor histidine kinase BaeS